MSNLKIVFKNEHIENALNFVNSLKDYNLKIDLMKTEQFIVTIYELKGYKKELVYTHLAEEIVLIYKAQFFEKNINISNMPLDCKYALIKALVLFDIETDIFYVLNELVNKNTILLDSLYNFCLVKLRYKWQEFVTITNLNNRSVLNYEVYIEFLKFLINAIQPKNKTVSIKSTMNSYVFFNDKDEEISREILLEDEMGLITNLVYLAPENINIYCINQLSNSTFKTLYYLFDKKINLLV